MSAANAARSATRSLRIIALPLTPHCNVNGKAVEHLTYYHFVTPQENKKSSSWAKWAVAKASDAWAGLGKAEEGTWKRKTFLYGERLVDRLDFEELALKSLDPSLAPKLSDLVPGTQESKPRSTPVIPMVYPSSVCSAPIPHLHSLLEKRTPRHKKGFWMWLLVSPLTAPFMIVPVIPNLPFFFCVWRSWSHYQAYKASQYLDAFLQQGAIVPEASPQLDVIYAKYAPAPPRESKDAAESASEKSSPESEDASASSPSLLLTKEAVPELQKTLELPEDSTFAADMYRALEQARIRLEGSAKK
ncbi:mitochondrial K+-H+ exchange-related-domain-containing protein [Cerioporus squamosus]|nr:mitochondrial K+-H+ exchange-related-domain-containing protein [Cerioporus squamosus]